MQRNGQECGAPGGTRTPDLLVRSHKSKNAKCPIWRRLRTGHAILPSISCTQSCTQNRIKSNLSRTFHVFIPKSRVRLRRKATIPATDGVTEGTGRDPLSPSSRHPGLRGDIRNTFGSLPNKSQGRLLNTRRPVITVNFVALVRIGSSARRRPPACKAGVNSIKVVASVALISLKLFLDCSKVAPKLGG